MKHLPVDIEASLVKYIGREILKKVPHSPGVYRFLDLNHRPLYIGKAKDLRKRLASYFSANPEKAPKKLVKFLTLARHLEWEVTDDEEAALLRENRLLRTLRPPFNTLNTNPHRYYFIGLDLGEGFLHLQLGKEAMKSARIFGAFKERRLTREAFTALARLLWFSLTYETQEDVPPLKLLSHKPFYQLAIQPNLKGCHHKNNIQLSLRHWHKQLCSFLDGKSQKILTNFVLKLLDKADLHPLYYKTLQADLETLSKFYVSGPRRLYRLRRFFQLQLTAISANLIDDYLVIYRQRK